MKRPTQATIRLSAIEHNLALAEKLAPLSRNIPVIKANAYGHGMVEVARRLEPLVPALAVAFFDEAVKLREEGIETPVLVLQGATGADDAAEAAARDFWLMLHSREQVDLALSAPTAWPLTAWLKIDSGMHRLGLQPDEVAGAVAALERSPNIDYPVVLCTHLACADDPENPMTHRQVEVFRACAEPHGLPLSIANSAGIMYAGETHADWNRPGYMLYGADPTGAFDAATVGLQPAMTLTSEIIAVREVPAGDGVGYGQRWKAASPALIGTVAIGYGDGYPRHAPDGTPVLVGGRRAALAGTVSMDSITVDLTGLEGVGVGDSVELWGANLSVNEVAHYAGTIGYELLAGLTARVPLFYEV